MGYASAPTVFVRYHSCCSLAPTSAKRLTAKSNGYCLTHHPGIGILGRGKWCSVKKPEGVGGKLRAEIAAGETRELKDQIESTGHIVEPGGKIRHAQIAS